MRVGSGLQTVATTPNQCIVGRTQPISLCKPCVMSVRGPNLLEELCKRIQHCCTTLRRSRNKRNLGSSWLKSLTGFKLCATTSNIMQQGVQTYATCNIQQCWELLANNVASVCTGLKKNNNPLHQQAVCLIFGLQRRKRGKAFFCSRLSSLIRLIWVIQNYHEGYQLHLAGKMFLNL